MSCDSLKKAIYEIYKKTKKEIGIVNEKKKLIAYSGPLKKEKIETIINTNLNFELKNKAFLNYTYAKLNLQYENNLFLFAKKDNLEELTLIKILIENFFLSKKTDKKRLIEKILKNEILSEKAEKEIEKLGINNEEEKVIILIKIKKEEKENLLEKLKEIIKSKNNFLVENLNETEIAILKILQKNEKKEDIEKYVKKLQRNLKEITEDLKIGIGEFKKNIKELYKSFKEAQIAIEIKEIFEKKDKVTYYSKLEIERIIYKLPIFICEKYIKEIFKKEKIENLEEEILSTIDSFFENNLNISETSRKLFIHRNTLIYRIEKIKNLTGLDLKNFKDATKFKLALKIQKYLDYVKKTT